MLNLKEHLEQENVVMKLYGSEFNHIIRTLYITVRRAVRDGANTMVFELDKFVWSSDDKILGDFIYPISPEYPDLRPKFLTEFAKMLGLDSVLNQSIIEETVTDERTVYRIIYAEK